MLLTVLTDTLVVYLDVGGLAVAAVVPILQQTHLLLGALQQGTLEVTLRLGTRACLTAVVCVERFTHLHSAYNSLNMVYVCDIRSTL